MTSADNERPNFKFSEQEVDVVSQEMLVQSIASAEKKLQETVVRTEERLRTEVVEAKKQYIEIFGIFAAIITFLGVEVRAFDSISSFGKVAGFSAFLISCVMYLIFALELIVHTESKKVWQSQIFWIASGFLVLSMILFWYAISGKILLWPVR